MSIVQFVDLDETNKKIIGLRPPRSLLLPEKAFEVLDFSMFQKQIELESIDSWDPDKM